MHAEKSPSLFFVNGRGIKCSILFDECERHRRAYCLPQGHGAIETGAPAGVTGPCPALIDLDPDGVLVAVDAHLDHALRVAGSRAFAPQFSARTAEVPGLAGLDR